MSFTNINLLTIIIFIGVLGVSIFALIKYKKLNISGISLIISIFFAMLIIFGPKSYISNGKEKTNGTNVMFVLDVSKSMNSADINYDGKLTTRLAFAKAAIENFIKNNTNNKYGLVIFTNEATSILPLTSDYNLFLTMLDSVNYKNLPKQGTNFEQALQLAFNSLGNKKGIIVFISDGGDTDYQPDNNFIKQLAKQYPNIKSVIIGVGTKKGGPIILGQDVFGDLKYQYFNGQIVNTKINLKNLKELAKDLGGKFIQVKDISDINKIGKILQKNAFKIQINNTSSYQDSGRIFILISFIFFLISMFSELLLEKFS